MRGARAVVTCGVQARQSSRVPLVAPNSPGCSQDLKRQTNRTNSASPRRPCPTAGSYLLLGVKGHSLILKSYIVLQLLTLSQTEKGQKFNKTCAPQSGTSEPHESGCVIAPLRSDAARPAFPVQTRFLAAPAPRWGGRGRREVSRAWFSGALREGAARAWSPETHTYTHSPRLIPSPASVPGTVLFKTENTQPQSLPWGGEGKEVEWEEVDPGRKKREIRPRETAWRGGGARRFCHFGDRSARARPRPGPARRGESPAAAAPPHALPRRPRARGRPGQDAAVPGNGRPGAAASEHGGGQRWLVLPLGPARVGRAERAVLGLASRARIHSPRVLRRDLFGS